ncbi:MAG: hypothetical protein IKY44_02195, partial [Clostridia bacterium]|nr:hypothetical protein [Clostridia bacterium]
MLASDKVVTGETLSAINVGISGKISLMFYFENLDGVSGFKVTVPQKDGSNEETVVNKSELKYDSEKDRYLLTVKLAAAQQTDLVTIRAISNSGADSSTIRQYSVAQYASKLFALADANPDNEAYVSAANTVQSMLNYGAMAQEYFDYNTKNLANTDLYHSNTNPIDDMSYSDMYGITEPRSFSTNTSIIKFKDATAYLEDTVSLRFRFEYNGTACEAEELITVINSVQYKNEVVCDENGDYYILINNIPATRFGTQYQINISDGAGNSAEMSYSVLNYLQTRLLSTNDQSMKNVAYSMFQFYVNSSIQVGNAVPGFDDMKVSCAHDRTYLDSVGGTMFFICSDCGETEEYVDFIETLDLGYKGEELLNIITDGVNDKGVSAVLCKGEYVRVTSDSSNDRYIGVNLGGEANVGSYMVVRYRTVIAPTKASVQIFATSGSTALTGNNDWFNACGVVADGRWHTLVIDLNESNAVSSGNGRLHHVRLDIFDSFPANTVIDFAYIGFCDSINDIAVASGEYLEYGNIANATWTTSYDVLHMNGVDAPRYKASVKLGPHQSSTLKGHVWLLNGWVAVDDCSITDISVCVVDEKGKEHWTAVTKDGTGSRWSENQGITDHVMTQEGYSASTKGYRIYPTVDLSEYYGQTVSLSVRVVTSKGFAVTIYVAFVEVPLGARPGYVSGEELAAGVTSSFSKTVNNDGSITITNTTGAVDGTINITSIIDRTSKYAVVRYKTTDDSKLYIYATSAGRNHTGVIANLKTDGEWHVAYLDLEGTSYNPG